MGHLDFWLVAILSHELKASLQETLPGAGTELAGCTQPAGCARKSPLTSWDF